MNLCVLVHFTFLVCGFVEMVFLVSNQVIDHVVQPYQHKPFLGTYRSVRSMAETPLIIKSMVE